MKEYLKISNKGLLDIRLISLMGGTTKSGDSLKIGHFGTGLKYTIAYLFRNKIDFKIFIGNEQVNITLDEEKINDEIFEIICINGHRTSITTKMGNDWDAWMVVRELYSNALDEGDASYSITELLEGAENKTSFYIELTPKIIEVYNNWSNYFIVDQIPFYETEDVKIFPQKGKMRLYKKGILIHESTVFNSVFNYDIKKASINELREYKGYMESDIAKILTSINDKKVIEYFLENVTEEDYEGANIDYTYWFVKFSNEWKDALAGATIIHSEAKKNLEARGIKIIDGINVVVPKKLYEGLSAQFEGVGALRVSKKVNDFFEINNERLSDKIKKAQRILSNAGYFIEPELSFVYGIFGDKQILARIDIDLKKIYISEKHLDTDMFSICTMLVEENEHYKTGFGDESRSFQQHFINLYTNSIIEEAKINIL